ncbi:MAG: hypothetical protein AB1295_00625 [Candidatus Micrarchaeota archaeon]
MAGKDSKRGSPSPAHAGYFPPRLFGASTAGMKAGWKAAKGLFDPRGADEALKSVLPFSDLRLAMVLFGAAGLLAFVFSLLTNIEMLYVLQMEATIYSEISSEPLAVPDFLAIVPMAGINFITYALLLTMLNLLSERIAFAIIRATGGKGRLEEQMLLASVIWLAISMTTAANLLAPVGFWILSLAILGIVGLLYLMAYTVGRAYSIVHGIGFGHAMAINIVLMIIRLTIWFYGSQLVISMLGASLEGV